tara:strand:+ start:778 stop:2196 length:1419 start_codon:yes stop_codon:yes gene_type:complete
MIINKFKNYRIDYIIIFIAVLLSIFWSLYNLKTFDKLKINYEGKFYNQLLYADLYATWSTADEVKKNLEKKQFTDSIPEYKRFLLPSIIVGFYYYIIDKEIFEHKEHKAQNVIKDKNYKFGLLLFQIFLYYSSLFFFSSELKKKISYNLYLLILFFLALEPSLLQWHSSFWSESIFLSLLLILFSLLLKKSTRNFINILIGIIIGLMFAQRAVSFLYILPVFLYVMFAYEKKIKVFSLILAGYLFIILSIGYNNYKKTDSFFFLSYVHQYYSYYHYFAPSLLADKKKISKSQAKKILLEEEKIWIKENQIDINVINDLNKNIEYRNKIFLREVLNNPSYFIGKVIKRTIVMCIIHPRWVHNHFSHDRTNPEIKKDPKKYYQKGLVKNVPYSIFIYVFVIVGAFKFFYKIFIKKKYTEFDKFLLFNILSILYFVLISGMWGNPKYFTPCMISLSLFFSMGFSELKKKYFNKIY